MISFDMIFNKMLENLNLVDLNIMEQALKDIALNCDSKGKNS